MFGRKRGGAWDCEHCPKDSDICPAWAEIIETHVRTAEERVTRECVFRLLPRLLVQGIKAANRPAAELSELRAVIAKASTAIPRKLSVLEE